jgi:hypothetical protein
MFTPGGQLDLFNRAVFGGKGGGGTSYTALLLFLILCSLILSVVSRSHM